MRLVSVFALLLPSFALSSGVGAESNVTQVSQTPPSGTTELRDWFTEFIPALFPNTTTHWKKRFDDGTIAPKIYGTFNGLTFHGSAALRRSLLGSSCIITSRLDSYVIEPTQITAAASDPQGRNGWVVYSGKTSLVTKEGEVYTEGLASVFATVEWDAVLEKRTVTEYREVNTPPNSPNYPWN
ncbi:hypothetical protein FA15DRAFT_719923 [Coprinopsis marcescibilis]|uniref:SnoaL-like domain-containing protein n=1 Tax=Coprinopsis marcescibilis TaxID=230819 RepID=A0A5C3L552_COPMA|nr:hypothetical protein FA15DRAFT_719923 [Coprinopsis marcescibilis]